MQGILHRYNNLSVAFYNLYQRLVVKNPLTPYTLYSLNKIRT
jgi:hypothetical protein